MINLFHFSDVYSSPSQMQMQEQKTLPEEHCEYSNWCNSQFHPPTDLGIHFKARNQPIAVATADGNPHGDFAEICPSLGLEWALLVTCYHWHLIRELLSCVAQFMVASRRHTSEERLIAITWAIHSLLRHCKSHDAQSSKAIPATGSFLHTI